MMTPEFGAFAPSPLQRKFRTLAHRLPEGYWGRRLASLLLGPAGGRDGAPKDVEIFESQKARLHPHDNICEKRVYLTPQLWDPEERRLLEDAIKAHKEQLFYFVDVGANAGLYSLFARAAAMAQGIDLRAACIEPDAEMQKRLGANIAASGAAADLRVFPYAVSDKRAPLHFSQNKESRGMSRVDKDGGVVVQGAPLAEIIQSETDYPRIDAMKMDIEGHEHQALDAFFKAAGRHLFPALIILETAHEQGGASACALCKDNGYSIVLQTRLNAFLKRVV